MRPTRVEIFSIDNNDRFDVRVSGSRCTIVETFWQALLLKKTILEKVIGMHESDHIFEAFRVRDDLRYNKQIEIALRYWDYDD